MRRRSSNTVKTLHSGHTFTSRDSFPPGVLPSKRQVIELGLGLRHASHVLQLRKPRKSPSRGQTLSITNRCNWKIIIR